MARSTLARHRNLGTARRYLREGNDGGGGGNGGQNAGGGDPGQTGGDGGSNTGGDGAGGSNTGGEPDRGFPANTPLVEMTTEQREAYHRYHSRQWQQRAESRSDYDEQKRLADLYRAQQRQNETPSEQALREAEERGRSAATAAKDEEQVQNLLRVSLTARVPDGTDIEDLVAAANPKAFITDGKVDAAKVSAYAARIAGTPAGQGGGQGGGNGGGSGQQRHGAGGHRSTEGGKPDVTDTRNSMERALGRRPKATSNS